MGTLSALLTLCEGNHRLPVDCTHKLQTVKRSLVFSLRYDKTSCWPNDRVLRDLRLWDKKSKRFPRSDLVNANVSYDLTLIHDIAVLSEAFPAAWCLAHRSEEQLHHSSSDRCMLVMHTHKILWSGLWKHMLNNAFINTFWATPFLSTWHIDNECIKGSQSVQKVSIKALFL